LNYLEKSSLLKGIRISILIPLLLFNACNLFLPNDVQKPDIEYEWNFLVYMAADNNLERFAIQDINEMEIIGSTDKVNVLILVDRIQGFDKTNGDWTGTRLYRIRKDIHGSSEIVSDLIKDYGELDMTDPQTLTMFLNFCNKNFYAKRTMLTLWSHGTGVFPRNILTSRPSRGFGVDYTTGVSAWNMLFCDKISKAIKESTLVDKIDIINFDACLMQMIEVAWELSDVAKVMVGSQTTVPGGGNNYASLLSILQSTPEISILEYASNIVDDFFNKYKELNVSSSYAAVNIDKFSITLKNKIAALFDLLYVLDDEQLMELKTLGSEITGILDDDYTEYIDFIGLLQSIQQNDTLNSYQDIIDIVYYISNEINTMIVNHVEVGRYSTTNQLFGLSINYPFVTELFGVYSSEDGYQKLLFNYETKWFELLRRISSL